MSSTATSGANAVGGVRELERRDLGDDHRDVVAGGVEQRAPDVPGGDARDPAARSMASISVVTVVLPLVPVTAINRGPSGRARRRAAARSISERMGTPASYAATSAG